jgi:hypothetical protein
VNIIQAFLTEFLRTISAATDSVSIMYRASNWMKAKKRCLYDLGKMTEAVDKVKNERCSISNAAKEFGVPRSTLSDRLNKNLRPRSGPPTLFTASEEKILENFIINLSRQHIPLTIHELIHLLSDHINFERRIEAERRGERTDNVELCDYKLSRHWFTLFKLRHPSISVRVPVAISLSRQQPTKEMIDEWFQNHEAYFKKNGYWDALIDPTRVFNLDETGLSEAMTSRKVSTCIIYEIFL